MSGGVAVWSSLRPVTGVDGLRHVRVRCGVQGRALADAGSLDNPLVDDGPAGAGIHQKQHTIGFFDRQQRLLGHLLVDALFVTGNAAGIHQDIAASFPLGLAILTVTGQARQIANYAAERGTTSVAFALAWVLKNRLVSATIAGPRTEAHWDSYMNALALQLTAEDEAFINSLVPPGHTSTPGYTDSGYPVEGRVI